MYFNGSGIWGGESMSYMFVFVFNSTEVRTETLTKFCVMSPLLVDTWPDFGLFRVVRPCM